MEEFIGKVVSIENVLVQGKLDAQHITVKPEKPVQFKPGQFMMLAAEGYCLRADPGKLKWTSYSLASAPGRDLEFCYTIKRTGGFTQHLSEHLKVGGVLCLKGPCGSFTLEENEKEKLFIATGAGISPILSMIRFLSRKGFPQPARLFYGFRTSEHFLFRKELEKLVSKGLEFIPVISRSDPAWKGERGHVQDILKKTSFNQNKQDVYLCGNPRMVEEVIALLKEKGFPDKAIHREQW